MKLYFDIGNTNIKLNFVSEKYNNYVFFATNSPCSLDALWLNMPEVIKNNKIERIFICSVVPKLTPIFVELSKKYFKLKPKIITSSLKLNIKLDVEDLNSLGNDLVSLGTYANYVSANTIIVNLGTATTIIHVKDKVFNGVIIMAGLKLQLESILNRTAKISNINIAYEKKNIGKNTKQALSIGIINSHIHSIKSHIKNIDKNAKVIISGGNAKKISNRVNFKYVKEATIEGIKIIEALNE